MVVRMASEDVLTRQHQPNPSPPPVHKVRFCYTKWGRLRFTSHRDLARVFERGLRRAGVPVAYSQGFSPHPRISWVGGAPTGVTSAAEYAELQLTEHVEPDLLRRELSAVLPDGMRLLDLVTAGAGSLSDRLEVSRWRIEFDGIDESLLEGVVERLMEADSVEVERMTKKGLRTLDARAAVVTARVLDEDAEGIEGNAFRDDLSGDVPRADDCPKHPRQYGILEMVVRHTTPVVRPDDVVNALRVIADLPVPGVARATRLAQGRLDDEGGIADPLAPDRAAAGAWRGDPAAG